MENERVLIATDAKTLKEVLSELFKQRNDVKELPEFEGDRISKPKAAKLAGISIPTLDKQIKLGKFKQYSLGTRRYFLRSEIIEALRNNF
jgi:predicted DNA-binding transcriptional regulator AlpA